MTKIGFRNYTWHKSKPLMRRSRRVVHAQRAGVVESGRTQTVKWTAEGAEERVSSILRRRARVRGREYDGTPTRAGAILKQGGTAESDSVLDCLFCQGRIFLLPSWKGKL